jgi:hypothetical protein
MITRRAGPNECDDCAVGCGDVWWKEHEGIGGGASDLDLRIIIVGDIRDTYVGLTVTCAAASVIAERSTITEATENMVVLKEQSIGAGENGWCSNGVTWTFKCKYLVGVLRHEGMHPEDTCGLAVTAGITNTCSFVRMKRRISRGSVNIFLDRVARNGHCIVRIECVGAFRSTKSLETQPDVVIP